MDIWAEIIKFQAEAGCRRLFVPLLQLFIAILTSAEESIKVALVAALTLDVRPTSVQ